jgi:pimeloyl-ACP methyl ester carboxylesterase
MTELRAEQTFSFRGAPVRYARLGQGPAMVCLHNGGTSSTIWRHVASAFANRREVFALDLPGFGASVEPARGLRLAELVELVVAFVEERGLAPVELVGNCMGSAIAIQVAARRPGLVRSLSLFNPLTEATFRAGRIGAMQWIDRRAPTALTVVESFAGRASMPARLARILLRTHVGDAGKQAKLPADPSLVACYTRPTQLAALRSLLSEMESFGALDRFTPGPSFPPMCTIWGEQNFILSAAAGRRLNERLKPSREVWLADCGHLPMLERPDACVDAMTDVLDRPKHRQNASTSV